MDGAAGGQSGIEPVVLVPAMGGSSDDAVGPEVVLSVQRPGRIRSDGTSGGLVGWPAVASELRLDVAVDVDRIVSKREADCPSLRAEGGPGYAPLSGGLRNVGDVGEAVAAGIANDPVFDPTLAAVAPPSPADPAGKEGVIRAGAP